jgi:hypothetical protein
MKALLPVSLLAAWMVSPAFADCAAPNFDFTVPDGSKATREEMLAAQHSIRDGDAALKSFADCLKTEQDARIAAGGDGMKDEEKVKISNEYATRQNAEVEKLQKLADEFNVALRAYKARQAPPAAAPAPAQPPPT